MEKKISHSHLTAIGGATSSPPAAVRHHRAVAEQHGDGDHGDHDEEEDNDHDEEEEGTHGVFLDGDGITICHM